MNESNLDIVLKRLKWKMSLLERLNVKKDSSMVKMAEAVKSGEADGCVSAGNTGALMSAGLFMLDVLKV
ncbi:hypothetical protein B9Y46_14390 [Staphylococcus aureus]|nr:hypothetical protein B9Y46_14390 [Staphylococcus aureus]